MLTFHDWLDDNRDNRKQLFGLVYCLGRVQQMSTLKNVIK